MPLPAVIRCSNVRAMKAQRNLAAAQFLLMSPAMLFMGALVVRQFSLPQLEPAFTAERIVMWYAHRLWTLYALLITLPFVALVIGCITVRERWRSVRARSDRQEALATLRGDGMTLFVSLMTMGAGAVLAIVALHMAVN